MFGHVPWSTFERLRERFGEAERRIAALENNAPAVSAALLDASDKLGRASARLERARSRASVASDGEDTDDEREIAEVWEQVRRRA